MIETGILRENEIESFLQDSPVKEASEEIFPEKLFENYSRLEQFETSVEFLAFFDKAINEGIVTLNPKQIEVGEEFCRAKASSKHPYKYVVVAANGSGKDCYIIAPLVLWFITCKIRARVIITSSSGVQLTNQTENYIYSLAEKVNSWSIEHIGAKILKATKRHIRCNLSGSEILLFATDEEGKAEGYHPLEPGAEMLIVVNEAKSVSPEIFRALRRCTGFTHWLNVSSPGEPLGDFYNSWENWKSRKRIDYYDSPHLSPEEFEEDKRELGEFSPLFRSKWLALFTFAGGKYVISHERLQTLKKNRDKIEKIGDEIRIGIDISLSTNGDETVISFFRGNIQTKQVIMRNKDATILAENISSSLLENNISRDHNLIFADDGGVGRAVIDILRRKRWNINRVMNQSPAKNKKQFRNRGAELWFKFNRLVESGGIKLLDDNVLFKQLASRKYKESEAGIDKLCLQSKKEMISEGLPSPDRADAAVLAFTDLKVTEFLDKLEHVVKEESENDSKKMSPEEIEDILVWTPNGKLGKNRSKTPINFSLSVALRRDKRYDKLGKYQY